MKTARLLLVLAFVWRLSSSDAGSAWHTHSLFCREPRPPASAMGKATTAGTLTKRFGAIFFSLSSSVPFALAPFPSLAFLLQAALCFSRTSS